MTPTTPDVTLFPRRQWSAALAAAVREAPAAALDYGRPQGDPSLRARLADELGRTRGVICDPSQILVVQGTTQGVDVVLRVLRERGATHVAVEDPSLWRTRDQVRGLGLSLIGQPVDNGGLIVEGLDPTSWSSPRPSVSDRSRAVRIPAACAAELEPRDPRARDRG